MDNRRYILWAVANHVENLSDGHFTDLVVGELIEIIPQPSYNYYELPGSTAQITLMLAHHKILLVLISSTLCREEDELAVNLHEYVSFPLSLAVISRNNQFPQAHAM